MSERKKAVSGTPYAVREEERCQKREVRGQKKTVRKRRRLKVEEKWRKE